MKSSSVFGSVISFAAAIASAVGIQTSAAATATAAQDSTAIRPFTIPVVPQSALDDLRRRVAATRWPEKETVNDMTQGVQLGTMQKLARYWAADYDWRKCEAKLKALPQFVTTIDGLDIHFIHVRSKNPNALPVIITHGWPGSIIEQLKIIDPLTNPTAHGGKAEDAFDVVIPSLPGYGYSGKPTVTGWDPIRTARAWVELMKRLGYSKYVAQGGDWGNAVTEQMALLAPSGLVGIHTNMPATVPPDIDKAAFAGAPPPSSLSADERHAYDQLAFFYKHGLGYASEMAIRPQTLRKTGFWLEEFAAPYFVFRDAGVELTLASPKGGQPPLDPKSDLPENQTPAMTRFKKDEAAQKALANTVKLADVKAEDFDTVFYPGGHGPMWDLAESPVSIALLESFYNSGKPIALVCHSPGVLRHVTYQGAPLVKGKHVTGFTNGEEEEMQLTHGCAVPGRR